jgi:hypothetical protein
LFSHSEPADLLLPHLPGKIQDSVGSDLRREAAGVDIGDQVAIGVGVRFVGAIGHVSGEAFGGGEAWALSDQ